MAILASQATRRDAKSYLGRFGGDHWKSHRAASANVSVQDSKTVHIALIKLCQADTLSSAAILPGLARTLVQLGRLGMPVCLIVEPEDGYIVNESPTPGNVATLREKYGFITDRIVDAIESQGGRAQPIMGELLTQTEPYTDVPLSLDLPVVVRAVERSILNPPVVLSSYGKTLLHDLMKRRQIPVVAPIAGGLDPSLLPISADCALFRICRGLSTPSNDPSPLDTFVERIILIDPVGGLPATERGGGSHIYINIEQEYQSMITDLSSQLPDHNDDKLQATRLHLRNLVLMKMCLEQLSPTSSGLITTPTIASETASESKPQSLIHNLLTDKPLISPSLPARRPNARTSKTTLFRRGLPVSVYKTLDSPADDGRPLDLPRLVQLIEDSFGRKLDVEHYLSRIRDKTAAVIVAGDYEGAAVVTNETSSKSEDKISVPYLDKFAVSRKAQGSGGVADIVFNVLVHLFPDDLIWRSRTNNPVNKWVYRFACTL